MRQITNNEEGFTLLEALISLLISTFSLFIITTTLLQASTLKETLVADTLYPYHNRVTITSDRQIEWHIFLNQLEMYLENTINPRVYNRRLVVDELNDEYGVYSEVSYQMPSNSTRVFIRRLNNGYQPMLIGASEINLRREEEGWVIIENTFNGEDYYYGRIWVESWIENLEENID